MYFKPINFYIFKIESDDVYSNPAYGINTVMTQSKIKKELLLLLL